MRLLGLRASPRTVTFAIFDTDADTVINVEDMHIPNAFFLPDALKFVRVNILDIIREYSISKAGIRITENNAQQISLIRVQIEGVIQEAFASSDLQCYYTGQSSTIASKCGFKSSKFLSYTNGEEDFLGVENWTVMSKEQREAILCAMGAKNA